MSECRTSFHGNMVIWNKNGGGKIHTTVIHIEEKEIKERHN